MDMDLKDYDSRTALHIAAAEGEPRVFRVIISGPEINIFIEWKSNSKSVPRANCEIYCMSLYYQRPKITVTGRSYS